MVGNSQDIEDVTNANKEFYEAFQSLALERMESVWLKEDYVKCVHPGWNLLVGYDSVMESWRRIFENTDQIRFVLADVEVEVRGSLAWVVLTENLASELPGGRSTEGAVLATNLFEKRDRVWYLIHHHASTVAFSERGRGSETIH
jgi:ketosteroid isomerase-like protein